MIKVADNINQMYLHVIESAMVGLGMGASPRGYDMYAEVLGRSHCLIKPRSRLLLNKDRNLNISFAVAEFLWIATGRNDAEMISFYNSQIKKYSDDGKTFFGAYGKRLHQPLIEVEQKLLRDQDSRQAIAIVFRPEDISVVTKDVPCTISLQFLIRDSRLNLIVHMRSNDVHLGFPYDIFSFTMLQELMAVRLGIGLGMYYHLTGSLHIYKENEKIIKDVRESLQIQVAQDIEGTSAKSQFSQMAKMPDDNVKWLAETEEEFRLAKDGVNVLFEKAIRSAPNKYWLNLFLILALRKVKEDKDMVDLIVQHLQMNDSYFLALRK